MGNDQNIRDGKCTPSIDVGSRSFVDRGKSILGDVAIGRKGLESGNAHHFREPSIAYGAHIGVKKGDIGPKITYFWDVNL